MADFKAERRLASWPWCYHGARLRRSIGKGAAPRCIPFPKSRETRADLEPAREDTRHPRRLCGRAGTTEALEASAAEHRRAMHRR